MPNHSLKSQLIKLAACALPLFAALPQSAAKAQEPNSGSTAQNAPFIQLASAQRRFNFRRENTRSQNSFYRKKKKRKYVPRTSYRQRLKNVTTWQVDENNKDPIQLIVERAQQRISVYKGAELVTTSNVSSGKKGHATPTGVFSILGKRVFHRSNIYSAAPMPYMQRLTWSGIALHASNSVPAYPASHGCVRLPNSFAPKLFKFTERGAHVIIADEKPHIVNFDNLAFLKPLSAEARENELEKMRAVLRAEKMKALKEKAEEEALKAAAAKKPQEGAAQTPDNKKGEEIAAVEPIEEPEVEVSLSQSPLRVLITRRMGRERVRDVQDMLRELGHDPGESDGYMGKDTGTAILAFQKANGFKETGSFSDELVAQLYEKARNSKEPTGYLYVRQEFKYLFSSPIMIKDPQLPLGTHLITAQHFTTGDATVRWRGMTLQDEVPAFLVKDEDKPETNTQKIVPFTPIKLAQAGGGVPATQASSAQPAAAPKNASAAPRAEEAEKAAAEKALAERLAAEKELADQKARDKITDVLARISVPQDVATRLSLLLTPGSSIAISDKGLSKETTPHGTDFILLTR